MLVSCLLLSLFVQYSEWLCTCLESSELRASLQFKTKPPTPTTGEETTRRRVSSNLARSLLPQGSFHGHFFLTLYSKYIPRTVMITVLGNGQCLHVRRNLRLVLKVKYCAVLYGEERRQECVRPKDPQRKKRKILSGLQALILGAFGGWAKEEVCLVFLVYCECRHPAECNRMCK
jgi:hypothetical protein